MDPIERTCHPAGAEIGRDVRVDHRRLQLGVPQQLLQGSYIRARLEQMGREGMAKIGSINGRMPFVGI
jgi:hypothetical protein